MKHSFCILLVVLFSLSCGSNTTKCFFYKSKIADKDSIIDKRYYIIGDVKSLSRRGVIRRAYGLSREFVPSGVVDIDDFICREEQDIDTLFISGHEPRVIGLFNRDCYEICKKGDCYQLVIKDNFWNYCHYLIVSYHK